MFVSYCFHGAGLPLEITTKKGFAYCPYGVKWFKDKGWWHPRTETPRPGDVVFYDWEQNGESDHVGIIEKVLAKGQIQAIEGNTGDRSQGNGGRVMRKTRSRSVIWGYGRPPYDGIPPGGILGISGMKLTSELPFPSWPGDYISLTTPLTESSAIQVWQQCMKDRGYTLEVDGVYGEESEKVCRDLQTKMGLEVDGVIGQDTWNASWRQPKVSRGNLSLDTPVNLVRYPLHHPVEFSGTVKNGIARVKLHTPWGGADYQLGEEVPVSNDGTWKSSYQFQTAGDRKIVVDGLDANNKVIDNYEVTIHLDPEGNNDVDSVQITSPANNAELDLEFSIVFKGIAQDDKIKSIKLRSPFGDKNFTLGKDIPISDGQWTYSFKFSTGGLRKIVAEGLDAQGKLIDSAAIEINLKSKASDGLNAPSFRSVIGIEKTSVSFRKKVFEIADELDVDPNYLMAAMSFESGGTFSPAVRNAAGSGAVGLIQFMPSTARSLGTSTSALARMKPEEQLDYVKKYFRPYRGKLRTLEDVYMAILYPVAIGKDPNHVLFRSPSVSYVQNKGLDDEGKGYVTVADATEKVRKRFC
jgi:peptidoglycan hydrolase-like protein with peptidoglycan-binding domain